MPEPHGRGQATRRSPRATSKSILKYIWTTQRCQESDFDYILSTTTSHKSKSLSDEVARLRIIKSQAEQKVMRAAADISGRAHAKVCIFLYSSDMLAKIYLIFRRCVSHGPTCLKPLLLLISSIYAPCLGPNDLHMCQSLHQGKAYPCSATRI
jgi:hypothetical protein